VNLTLLACPVKIGIVSPELEPRSRWPRGSPCAAPQVEIEGEPGDPAVIEIDYFAGRRHLPVISARRAA